MDDPNLKIKRYKFYVRKFQELSASCQELLKMYLNGVDDKRIAEHFGFATLLEAKKRRVQCRQNLIKLIQKDPEYHDLFGDEEVEEMDLAKALKEG